MKTIFHKLLIIGLLYILLTGCDITIDFGSNTASEGASEPPPAPTAVPPQPTEIPPGPSIPTGWNTYRNDQIGFEISYPTNYQALDDANNLYGWTNGVVLLYNSGQSYDIAIQLWNSQVEYESEFSGQMGNITVHPVGNQFLTIMNITQEPENPAIIATFHLIN